MEIKGEEEYMYKNEKEMRNKMMESWANGIKTKILKNEGNNRLKTCMKRRMKKILIGGNEEKKWELVWKEKNRR